MKATLITTTYEQEIKDKITYNFSMIPDTKELECEIVNLYPDMTYQTFEGFGAALTESAGYTLSKLSKENYDKVVNAYYGIDGIGYVLGRVHLDSCDFSLNNYSAVEDPKDTEFKTFSLERDSKYVQPLVKKAVLAAAPNKIELMITPWSPLAFMKTTDCRNAGGRLKKENYANWARYICKYINEYKKCGIEITMMTIQNEPNAATPWDSCQFTGAEEKDFLQNYLYPEMKKQKQDHINIYIWDHNKERVFERAKEVIDENTSPMVAGVAFHWYMGDHFDALQLIRDKFPDKKLIHTEGCVEFSLYDSGDQLEHAQKYAHDIIGNFNAGMNSYIDWNLTLDEKGGPNHLYNYCGAPVMCDTVSDTVEFRLIFDYIEHFSRYIKPGAKRIGFSKYTDLLEMTAFQNPDGTLVAVFLNRTNKDIHFHCRVNGSVAGLVSRKNSMSTMVVTL
jgi:glucosylceramidase